MKDTTGAAEFAKVVGQIMREEIGAAAELRLEELLLKGSQMSAEVRWFGHNCIIRAAAALSSEARC